MPIGHRQRLDHNARVKVIEVVCEGPRAGPPCHVGLERAGRGIVEDSCHNGSSGGDLADRFCSQAQVDRVESLGDLRGSAQIEGETVVGAQEGFTAPNNRHPSVVALPQAMEKTRNFSRLGVTINARTRQR